MEKLVFILMSAVFRRRGLLLFAPLLYISGMLLYMGSLSFDVVSIKNGVVLVHKRAPPGSVYRSPQLFQNLWPLMEADNGTTLNVVSFLSITIPLSIYLQFNTIPCLLHCFPNSN